MTNMFKRLFILLILATAACSQTELPVADPQANMAAIRGRIVSSSTGEPLTGVIVRLGSTVWEENKQSGAYLMDEAQSPGTRTDAQGNFVFENVPPEEYVVLVGYSSGQYKVIAEGDKPLYWQAEAGEVLDLGVLESDLIR